jgi:hypothetical protein
MILSRCSSILSAKKLVLLLLTIVAVATSKTTMTVSAADADADADATSETASVTELSFGSIVMQLRSEVDSDSVKLNRKMQSVTSNYLNEYFYAYYESTEPGFINYFSHIDLSTKSFGVHGVEGSFITTLEIEGSLSFNSDKLPSNFFIDTLLRNAFSGYNEQLYLTHLITEGNDDAEEFLQKLTYMIIDINGSKVVESRIQDNKKVENIPDHSSSTVGGGGVAAGGTNSNNNEGANKFSTEEWIMIFVYSTLGLFGSVVILCFAFYISRYISRRCCDKNERSKRNKEPMKVIRLPVKKRQPKPSSSSNRGENRNNGTPSSATVFHDNDKISPTSSATTKSSAGSISDHMDRPAPSPQRSMMSQASSKFTYTDNMSKYCASSIDGATGTSISGKFSMDGVPSIDLATWRGGKQDPPAFGNDISVIESDLTLIQECEEDNDNSDDVETGCLNNKNRMSSGRNSRAVLDERQSKARISNQSEAYYYYQGSQVSTNDDGEDEDDSVLDTSTSDVISDLRNLSIQIERERSIRTMRKNRIRRK